MSLYDILRQPLAKFPTMPPAEFPTTAPLLSHLRAAAEATQPQFVKDVINQELQPPPSPPLLIPISPTPGHPRCFPDQQRRPSPPEIKRPPHMSSVSPPPVLPIASHVPLSIRSAGGGGGGVPERGLNLCTADDDIYLHKKFNRNRPSKASAAASEAALSRQLSVPTEPFLRSSVIMCPIRSAMNKVT